jgi:hypothetical protein
MEQTNSGNRKNDGFQGMAKRKEQGVNGYTFQSYKMKSILKRIGGDSFTVMLMYLISLTYTLKNSYDSWVPVVHACNPSYSGGRDQEDLRHSKPARANSP